MRSQWFSYWLIHKSEYPSLAMKTPHRIVKNPAINIIKRELLRLQDSCETGGRGLHTHPHVTLGLRIN